jgi:uncharacterized repeat protein (TIGR03806 family)
MLKPTLLSNYLRMLSCALLLSCAACGDDETAAPASDAATDAAADAAPDAGVQAVTPAPADEPWPMLSDWHLFEDIAAQKPSERVLPYAVNAELYADEADKHRFVWIPEGSKIEYVKDAAWRFPVGTILVKTFLYAHPLVDGDASDEPRLLETRLLVRGDDQWHAHTYVYENGNGDARRIVAGKRIELSFVDGAGETRDNRYAVPNTNQCGECHGKEARIDTLGGTTRQLNRQAPDAEVNQIERFIELGWLEGAEPAADRQVLVDPFGDAPLVDRMRAYTDANCGHCHNEDDEAGDDGSGLWLRYDLSDPETAARASLGICKMPQSAGGATCGHVVDVVPGNPDESIMICRMESEEPKVRMPPVGRNLQDEQGLQLIRDWIESLDGSCN